VIEDFVKLLTKYQCRMTGIDLSRMDIEMEEGASSSYMLSSKKRYEILNKLKSIIEAKNIEIA